MSTQLHHNNSDFIKKSFSITLVCDQVNSPANIGSIFRLADSFGVEKIIFCGQNLTVISKRMIRTARSTYQFVPYEENENCLDVVHSLKESNYRVIALEITDSSVSLPELKIDPNDKIAIIIGEENFGISAKVLEEVDYVTHINMYGRNSSMNVASATGIALYEITNQILIKG